MVIGPCIYRPCLLDVGAGEVLDVVEELVVLDHYWLECMRLGIVGIECQLDNLGFTIIVVAGEFQPSCSIRQLYGCWYRHGRYGRC